MIACRNEGGTTKNMWTPSSWRQSTRAATWEPAREERFHVVAADRGQAFRALGCRRGRAFFPHRIHYLPKLGPDALHLAEHMVGVRDPDALWLVTVHATDAALRGLPPDIFQDDDVVWHRQQLGMPGHIAYAVVARTRRTLYVLNAVAEKKQQTSGGEAA
jgi:hypothetical protein